VDGISLPTGMAAKVCVMKGHILSRIVNSSGDMSPPSCSRCLLPIVLNEEFVRKRSTRNGLKYYHVPCGRHLNVI
jgi:hypothetical protein